MNRPSTFQHLPLAVRLLLVNQFAGNTGFYLLIPFLADYLLHDIGLSAATVGVVLGVRNLSQQGLFLIGGSASDRLGARNVIIVGAAVRTAGFALFAVGGSLPVVLLAAALTGFAGALFNPAVRAYIAVDSGERRAEAFALFNVFGNAGATLGPVLGIGLMALGFRLSAIVAAGIFAILTVAQIAVLPRRTATTPATGVLADLRGVLTDRPFWAFALALMGMFALQSQIYFILALQAQQIAGPEAATTAVAAVFVTETAVVIAFQLRVTRLCQRMLTRGSSMALGLAVMGLAFVVPPLGSAAVPAGSGLAVRLGPVLLAAIVLAAGTMIAQPFVNELIPSFGGGHLPGTYFGAFYLVAGLATVGLTPLVGAAVDAAGDATAWAPSLLCAATGTASGLAVLLLHRRGAIPTTTRT